MIWVFLFFFFYENIRTYIVCLLGYFFCRYEEEINKRIIVENEFVVFKKVRRGWVFFSYRGSGEWRVGGGDIREEIEVCAFYRGVWS